jgi:RNA ligase (TIGR02306 family)
MSTFKAEAVSIDEVLPHPNADRLDLIRVRGWKAVAQKGLHQPGNLVVYIPEAAILPPAVLQELNLEGKLSGKDKNRVKAIRLRGELSQGVIMPAQVAERLIRSGTGMFDFCLHEGSDVTELLGITKYEEPIPVHMAGQAVPRPSWMPKYTDIENWKNFPGVLQAGETVAFTEKLHGANMAVGVNRAGDVFVSSRNLCLAESETNSYWRAARENRIAELLLAQVELLGADHAVVYGELLGVQDLKYGCLNGRVGFRWFDLLVDGQYVDYNIAEAALEGLQQVPGLYYGPFSEQVMLEHTDGPTVVNGASHIREGIVMRPIRERHDVEANLGRVILKSISADYLLRSGGTEMQ